MLRMRSETMFRNVFFPILVCAFVGAAPATGQVYKWVDEKGSVHFSDSPPITPPAKAVEVRDSRPPPPMVEGQPTFQASAPVTPPAQERGQPGADYGHDSTSESGDGDVVVQPGDDHIYDPDVIDALRRDQLRDRLNAPARDGSAAPVRPVPRRGRR
jgi:hypothetical protein